MAIKRIIVPIAGAASDRAPLKTALAVARPFDGHVEAVYRPFLHEREENLRRLTPGHYQALYRQLEETSRAYGEERDAEARRLFDEVIREEGAAYADKPAAGQASASWRAVEGALPEAVAYRGGVADLVVVGRPEGDAPDLAQATAEAALFGSACAVLLAPPVAPMTIGERVLIGWNRTVPAQRAVARAMSLLARAKEITVFSVATGAKQGPSPQEAAEHLTWHGIPARVMEVPPDQRAVGRRLLDEAEAVGADLLVMGAYSRSRLRETLLGGVTRHVLGHAALPVLMAH